MKIDLLIRHAEHFNVYTGSWSLCDLAVLDGRILYVGDADDKGFDAAAEFDAEGRPLVPGLIDIHMHIESSYCSPGQFSQAVLPRGITTVVSEPHEMANVFGPEGIEEMIRLSRGCDMDIFYGIPSSVPSTSDRLETTGGRIRPEDAAALTGAWPEVVCVGEVMSYAAILRGEWEETRSFLSPLQGMRPLNAVEGHCPGITDLDLARVLFEGIDSDHCLQSPEGMMQRFEQGMFVELQYKSLSPEIVDLLKGGRFRGLYALVTDDTAPDILERQGHLDGVLRRALELGLPLDEALIAASWSPARRIGFRDRGALSPGKKADLILLESRRDFTVRQVFKDGRPAGSGGGEKEILKAKPRFLDSLRLPGSLSGDMFSLPPAPGGDSICLRAIEKNSLNTYSREGRIELPVSGGAIDWENRECNLLTVTERYSGRGDTAKGLMTGCFFKGGAVAATHAHDSHNLLIAGDNREDMLCAGDWVIARRGGICVSSGGRIVAALALPLGGILSEEPMELLCEKMIRISDAMRELGFEHPNPLMSFTTLTLPVSPEIKITDKGLVRTLTGEILPLFPEDC
jgi:adenine deaminase